MKNYHLFLILFLVAPGLCAQVGVRFENRETTSYISSMMSDDYTYMIWDRNDDGDGHFASNDRPMFMYWDYDDQLLGYLIDTRNMTELKAKFHSLGLGTASPQYTLDVNGQGRFSERLHVKMESAGGIHFGSDWVSYVQEPADRFIITHSNTGEAEFEMRNIDGNVENSETTFRGKVAIGITKPDATLTVKGDIHAERVKVDLNIPAPDYVFEEDYNLRSLEETALYIEENKHLPEVPSAKELEVLGIDLVEMNMLLLRKIEELTLHVIDLKKENENQQNRILKLENQ